MTPVSQIAPKLQRLLLLLSSNQPGEVVAAAAAIGRTLRAAGCDWHDLAAGISPAIEPMDWRAVRALCLKNRRLLRGRELDFVVNLGDWHGDLTNKQSHWLNAIYARIRRATA
jgi:hypothetical protein